MRGGGTSVVDAHRAVEGRGRALAAGVAPLGVHTGRKLGLGNM